MVVFANGRLRHPLNTRSLRLRVPERVHVRLGAYMITHAVHRHVTIRIISQARLANWRHLEGAASGRTAPMRQLLDTMQEVAGIVNYILDESLLFVALANVVDVSAAVHLNSVSLVGNDDVFSSWHVWLLLHITVGSCGAHATNDARLGRVE